MIKRDERTLQLEQDLQVLAQDGRVPYGTFERLARCHGLTRARVQQIAKRVGITGRRREAVRVG